VTNCRNTRRIGEETALLSGFPSPPFRLGQVDGLAVDYRYWKTASEQSEKLSEVVRQLLEEGLRPEDLVILSAHRFPDSVVSGLSCHVRRVGRVVAAYELRSGTAQPRSASVAFATVQAFKGMESPVVIYCDIDCVETEEPQSLLYVGMSRARSLLVMMVHERVRESIGKALVKKLGKEWQL
jgi:superfamily I DNA/RNA helicase